jgi:phosphoribosylanthranilate isomerase
MTEDIQIKVCGLTTPGDAAFAAAAGADALGFNLHPKSPRYVSLAQFRAMSHNLPKKPLVAVAVEPRADDLAAMRDAGFGSFQIHFRHELAFGAIEAWSKAVGVDKLWLAPKLPPAVDVPEEWLALSHTIMLDTFDPALFGGTGRTGDWPKFKRHREAHPKSTWILAGGLNPSNVRGAIAGTGARFVDVNSGVESSPGFKDHAKLTAFFAAVRRSR